MTYSDGIAAANDMVQSMIEATDDQEALIDWLTDEAETNALFAEEAEDDDEVQFFGAMSQFFGLATLHVRGIG